MRPADHVERLYDAHASVLYAFLLNLTRNEADTRDLLQEIFLKLAGQPDLLAEARDERAFLLRLAHNLAIDQMRRRQTREGAHERLGQESSRLFVSSADPDEEAFRSMVSEAVGELPAEQRAVLHLKLWGEMTFEEIAGTLAQKGTLMQESQRSGLQVAPGRSIPMLRRHSSSLGFLEAWNADR